MIYFEYTYEPYVKTYVYKLFLKQALAKLQPPPPHPQTLLSLFCIKFNCMFEASHNCHPVTYSDFILLLIYGANRNDDSVLLLAFFCSCFLAALSILSDRSAKFEFEI